MSKELFELIENLIIDVMRQGKIPGLSIGIVKDGKSIYTKGFGARNLKENLPFNPDTLFGIGSISKSFTSMAIMQLVEEGKIDIQDPVKKYINFKLGKRKNPILIHHLLSHSSGFPELNATISVLTRQLGSLDMAIPMSTWDDFLLHINSAGSELFDLPEKCFFYNNDMYTCLGLIIEKITNMKFKDYIRKNILLPLEMKRSIYSKEEFEKDENTMTGYLPTADGKSLRENSHPFDKLIYPAGGLLSSVREMQNYIIALLNEGKFNNKQIIEKSSIDKMWTPHNKIPEETSYGQGDAWYGYGWMIEKNFFGDTIIQHGGNAGTSCAILALYPAQKIGVIIGVNCNAPIVLGVIARGLFALLTGKDLNEAAPIIRLQQKLNKITGKYTTYKGLLNLDVLFKDGIIYAKIKDPISSQIRTAPLAPENLNELKFYIPIAVPNQKIKVQFFIDKKSGKVHATADRYYFHKVQ